MNKPYIPDLLLQQSKGNNPIPNILQMIDGGMNPQMLVQQMLKNSPEAQQFMSQMQNQSNGRSVKGMALQFAQQIGVSEQEVMQLANRLGLH